MKQQVIITKSVVGWYNIKDTNHNLLLNIAPDVFKEHFPEVSEDIYIACMELEINRILELKNKKKVGN
ncbi:MULTISPECIES: pathogenicity island protein [Staphylococcus]|uniref:pathogenicity island protein n=1 Tax=Staphylococcus TaxID=1279 RepID=UPI0008A531CD|nr:MULTISPECIES: pathogenicity island protein [Staphylococcus]MDK8175409.1 pathogenicity island protein [Staphylococcus simulans]MDY5060564.1 pathogenicity island protein [Staphylococcus simulans]OFO48644.1 pathogenicity island protein [Staphylococcus sp. HMSC072B07]OFU81107.1 pathogenicity island protein [Staphylococcus sp. HMSC10C03]OHR06826.1 pathogenicity island protein [Staphylococcus sp. HMSC078A12]